MQLGKPGFKSPSPYLVWVAAGALALALATSSTGLAQPTLKGPEAPYQIQWPKLPEVKAGEVKVAGREPGTLPWLVDGSPPPEGWDGALKKGQTLVLPEAGGHVLITWRDGEGGFVLHQLLEGPGQVTVDDDGRPKVEGLGWVHLFRALSDALSPYRLTYEEVNTGFESTEVAYIEGRGGMYLLVVEGLVAVGEGPLKVEEGRRALLEEDVSRARRARGSLMEDAITQGTEVELALLPEEGICMRDEASTHLGGEFVSTVCMPELSERRGKMQAGRPVAYALKGEGRGEALVSLGDVYLSGGRFAEAASTYGKALKAGVEDGGEVARELGNARWAYGDGEGAVKAFEEAVARDGSLGGGWLNLGLASGAMGDIERAEEALEEAIRVDPSLMEAQLRLGQVYLARGRHKAAVGPLSRALEAGYGEVDTLQGDLSRALRESGDSKQAVKLGRARVQGQPQSSAAWFDLARSLLKDGKQVEALRAYERALDLEMDAAQ